MSYVTEHTARPTARSSTPDSPVVSRDHRLQISRRIDWRFLLPDLSLGRVGLGGEPDEELARALAHFSASLTRLEDVREEAVVRQPLFDLVVLRNRGASRWEQAIEQLEPGGFVYCEIERPRAFLTRGALPGARWFSRGARRAFERVGLERVRFHWHRPSFRSCREMVPLDDHEALDYALLRESGSRAGKIELTVARLARRLGCLSAVVPCVSVLAQKARS